MKERIKQISQFEFIALMASLMAITSLSVDALLPALGVIGDSIGLMDSNQSQLLITMMFLGLGIGQLISGPLSDSFGRKPVTYFGFLLFVIASIISVRAKSLDVMIIGRMLQGVGLSAPKTISMAIIRDSYSGSQMARIMSFITVIFMIVPALAPSYGKLMLDFFSWESIFYSQAILAIAVVIWFAKRQRETLKAENKVKFSRKLFWNGIKVFFNSKQASLYTVVIGLVVGSFLVFLSTAQNVLGEQYGLENEFPYMFAAVALTIGVSTFLNGIFVIKFGMRRLIIISSVSYTLITLTYVILFYGQVNPSIYVLMAFLMSTFFTFGFLFGNLSALAMEPLGKIAGIGAAINGFLSTIIAVPIAGFIGGFLVDTAMPLFVGFLVTGFISVLLIIYGNIAIKRIS